MDKVYLIYQCDFPTDFDGELKYVTLDQTRATIVMSTLGSKYPNAEIVLKTVKLDELIEE